MAVFPFFEPYKIKVVEKIPVTERKQREEILRKAKYNPFLISSRHVTIDLLTDSGTGAMSDEQWAALMRGDEAYAGSRSCEEFQRVVQSLTGYRHVLPVHQGRAAEKILCALLVKPGDVVINNTHFDTTRAHVEHAGGIPVDLPVKESFDRDHFHPFKGNIDLERFASSVDQLLGEGKRIPFVMITITNNARGGQPVSLANVRGAREILEGKGIPLFLDACRFAENAYLVQQREEECRKMSVEEIAKAFFAQSDGCTMSAKKDGLVNIGGFIGFNDDALSEKARSLLILHEGYSSYGGLSGRDLACMAVGLREVLDPHSIAARVQSVGQFGEKLRKAGIPLIWPPGGHAIYIDAHAFLSHIPISQYPGQALVIELYLVGGIRATETGSVMFGKRDPETGKEIPAQQELVRLALPRRVYTENHLDYVVAVLEEIWRYRGDIPGYQITHQPERLRHFTAEFEPVPA